MKTYHIILIVAIFSLFFAGCVSNPVTGKSEFVLGGSTAADDAELGRRTSVEIDKQYKQADVHPAVKNYVNYVGQKIAAVSHAPDISWQFNIVDDESVNAFALPGGYIYIITGMLRAMKNEAQLAAVLSHEAIHVTARHSAAAMGRQTLFSVGIDVIDIFVEGKAKIATQAAGIASQFEGLRYNRGQENEADMYGLDYLVDAGYDPYAMVGLMEVLKEQSKNRTIEFFSTHPSPDNRIEKIQAQIHEKGFGYNRGIINTKDYQNIVLNNLPQVAN